MILATHTLVGAAAAELFPSHPILAFFAGFISHFILDAIPHEEYALSSAVGDRDDVHTQNMGWGLPFVRDILRIGADWMIGLLLVIAFFGGTGRPILAPLAGALGGVAPDALLFLYYKLRWRPLEILGELHVGIQRSAIFRGKFGVSLIVQAAIVLAVYGLIGR